MNTKRLSCVVSVLLLSSAFFSVLATVPVSVNATSNPGDEKVIEATDDGVYFTVGQTSLTSQIPGVDSSLKENQRSIRGDLKMNAVPVNGLKSARFPDLSGKIGEDDPSPAGTIDPEPMDAPFLPNDVLVYNDIVNSEKNVSLAKTSNGTLYAAYDHDIGTGLRDVYVSKSTDGGSTWAKRDIAVDAAEDESCPSIAGDYSPNFGSDILYAWYSNPTFEFAWSLDGDTWSIEDFGGGETWWEDVRCPYVDVRGDFVVIVSEDLSPIDGRDNWRILYTLDGMSWTMYYWNMWPGAWVYQPRVSIMDDDEIFVVMDVYDKSDPDPGNWFHDTVMAHGTLTNDFLSDSWDSFLFITGIENLALTSPTVEAFGQRVTLAQEVYNPGIAPLSTSLIYCLWTPDFGKVGGANWYPCEDGIGYIAYDLTETKNQKYPSFYQEDGELHFSWLNGTDINYRFSPDGGFEWLTGPMKVNDPGSSTVMDAWHSPDVISDKGRPYIAWHDTRGSDDIYFQTFETNRWYGIRTDQSQPGLQVREVGDSWHSSSAYYLWGDGSSHDVEAQSSYEIPADTRYSFSHWDDGQLVNPATVTVSDSSFNITAQYDLEFWLEMMGGTTNPPTGWRQAYTWINLSASPPAAPPGGQYIFMGWSGDFTGMDNPCVDCVYMDGPKTIIVYWMLQWSVTIDTIPTGLTIQVNGNNYGAPHTTWFNDSEMYTINTPSPQGGPTSRYVWSDWSDSGPQSHNVFVIAPWASFTASFLADYQMTIDTNPTGLKVKVNGTDYTAPYTFWCPENTSLLLEATSLQYPGTLGERYAWSNWSDGGSQIHQLNCTGPETIVANYILQRSVNITTGPSGFNVIVDGQTYATPLQIWFNDSSMHVIEALGSIPIGANNRYNFTVWSNFCPRVCFYWANVSDDSLAANYGFQHKITFQSNSPGTTIELDGSPLMLPYVFWCDDGSSHIVNAPDPQTFVDTRYIFNSWSDMGAKMHNINCLAPSIIQVDFDKEYRVYIYTTLDGVGSNLDVIVGVTTYPTPAGVWWPADTMMALDTNEFQPGQNPPSGMRYKFGDWDDSMLRSRMINVNTPGLAYVANFGTQYKLTFVDPHGTPMTTPTGDPVTDGLYFDMGTSVTIATDDTVPDTADHRWRFDGWSSGDLGGYTGPQIDPDITMSGPITQTVVWIDQYMLSFVSAYGMPIATGWHEQQGPTEYWYDMGDVAFFFVETEVFLTPGQDSKAVFDSWVGGTNGTTMNSPVIVTASWHLEHLVTLVSSHGTTPPSTWVVEGESYALTIEEFLIFGESRHYFSSWTTADTGNGGYQGTNRQVTLTVTGPITETAVWETQYLLTIVTAHGTPSASGEAGQQSSSEFWFAEATSAIFWVDDEVLISSGNDEKVVFDAWTGGMNGTTMTAPLTVTATWHTEYLVTVDNGGHGTEPAPEWVIGGGTYDLAIENLVEDTDTRYRFSGWTSLNGYEGPDNEATLTVTSPIAETATWITEYSLTIVSVHGADSIGTPLGAGWYEDGSTAEVVVSQSVTILDTIYTFENWVGTVAEPNSASTSLVMNEPKLIYVEWSSQPVSDEPDSQPLDLILILSIVVIVIVIAIAAMFLMKRRKPVEDEAPETDAEEDSVEEYDIGESGGEEE